MNLHLAKLSTILTLILGTVFIISSSHKIISSDDDYALDNYIQYDDFIYDDSIKTVLLHNINSQMSYPIISIGGNEAIKLSFDDGVTWTKGKTIYEGKSAYSSLCILKNGNIGLFFEKNDYQECTFVSFSFDWLSQK